MAKKKDVERKASSELLAAFQGGSARSSSVHEDIFEELRDHLPGELSDKEKENFARMFDLASRGITPEEYGHFYQIFHLAGTIAENVFGGSKEGADEGEFPFLRNHFGRCEVKEYEPLKDASERTLILKIQMKDVTKPPMWREVEVPADYDFLKLHEIIQEVTGLEDEHLWQFNVKAYDESLQIGVAIDRENPYERGLDYITHDAESTPLTRFLNRKGDKLEYVYDFGDDWVFKVEVKDVVGKKIGHPVCTKFKSELNAIEDFGGVWAYTAARDEMENWGKMTKRERKGCAEEKGFDSADEYIKFLNEHRISPEDVNDALNLIG